MNGPVRPLAHDDRRFPVPAVTVSDLTTLPAMPALDRAQAVERPVQSVTTAPRGLEGEGFPVRRALRRRPPAGPRSVRAHGPDGGGRVRPRGAEGHAVAPPSRVRDGDLHDRRHLPAPGLARRWRRHQGRRHAMDDGGKGHSAHRDAARRARGGRWPVPRHTAVGQSACTGQDDRAGLPGSRSR